MSLAIVDFSGTSDLLLGRDKARRKALLRQSLARALSTSLDQALASLDAQGFNEAHPKEAAVMAVDSSSMKRRPVLLEEAALSDTMNEAR